MFVHCSSCVSKNWSKGHTTGRSRWSAKIWWFQNSRMFINSTFSALMNHWNRNIKTNAILTSKRRVLLDKLIGPKLAKKFPAFYGTRRFITAVTTARNLSLSWNTSIQSIPTSYFLKIHFNIILPLTPGSSNWFVSLSFPHKNPLCTIPLRHTYYMPHPPHSPWFDHPNNIWWAVITKLLLMQSSSLSSRPSYAKISSSAAYSRASSAYIPPAVWQSFNPINISKNYTRTYNSQSLCTRGVHFLRSPNLLFI